MNDLPNQRTRLIPSDSRPTGLVTMGRGIRYRLLAGCAVALFAVVPSSQTTAQICQPCELAPVETYRITPKTVIQNQEVTTYKTVEETSTKQRQVTQLKPVIRTEQRERRQTVLKPVVETDYETRRRVVREPVTETVMEQRERTVTEYVEETAYREVQEVIPRTVEETQMQERQRVVRKPVVETQYRQTPVTSYKPVTTYRQQLVNQSTVVNQLVTQPGTTRNRLRFLSGTYYSDPVTAQQVYRRPGLYWVDQGQPATTAIVPTVVPNYQVQQIPQTSYVPETTMNTEAVEVTRYVDEVVTEKVPVTVRKTENEVVTRRVPYTVRKPVTRTIVESVPVQRTTYRERVIEEQVPVQRTTMQRIETVEPYEVQVKEYEEVTTTEEVPVTERRLVPIKEIRPVRKTVYFRERLDPFGNPIESTPIGGATLEPAPSTTRWDEGLSQADDGLSVGEGSTLSPIVRGPLSSVESSDSSTGSSSTEAADETPMLKLLKPFLEETPEPASGEERQIELEPEDDRVDA